MSCAQPLQDDALPLWRRDPRADGAGEPVLFVHGFAHNHAVWSGVADALPSRWRPISVDLRGHGASPWSPPGCYAIEDHARDLGALVEELDLRDLHVVAHSMGGNAATLFAAVSPRRVRSLTLVDTGPALSTRGTSQVLDEVEEALRSFPTIEAYRKVLSAMHPFAEAPLLDRLSESSLVRRLDGRFEPALDPGVMGGVDAVFDPEVVEARLWEAFCAVECPILVARGSSSSVLQPEAAKRMADAHPEGRVQVDVFEGAGHAVMIDASEAFLRALVVFLEAIPAD
jgi:pimeloyl-ACP methyl ester carboxylesterase